VLFLFAGEERERERTCMFRLLPSREELSSDIIQFRFNFVLEEEGFLVKGKRGKKGGWEVL
jgi:hypothetical protein